jgi:aspartyl-tRNA(Asn)/glutamyl-tRNA(Gln) amidotransferase subunit B
MFVADARFGNLFEATVADIREKYHNDSYPKTLVANYIGSDIAGLVSKFGEAGLANISGEGLATVVMRLLGDEISSRGAKDAIAEIFVLGGDLSEVSKKYVQQSNTDELKKVVGEILLKNEKVVADYKNGKEAALQFLVGQGMKATKGAANPETLRELIKKAIG